MLDEQNADAAEAGRQDSGEVIDTERTHVQTSLHHSRVQRLAGIGRPVTKARTRSSERGTPTKHVLLHRADVALGSEADTGDDPSGRDDETRNE